MKATISKPHAEGNHECPRALVLKREVGQCPAARSTPPSQLSAANVDLGDEGRSRRNEVTLEPHPELPVRRNLDKSGNSSPDTDRMSTPTRRRFVSPGQPRPTMALAPLYRRRAMIPQDRPFVAMKFVVFVAAQ